MRHYDIRPNDRQYHHKCLRHYNTISGKETERTRSDKDIMTNHSIPVSVCIIARNEEKNIGKCLDALKPYGFEIIVVDTGSTDRTREIASQYTDKIYDFAWINDFSAARNFSLEQASHDYVLVLDCDEVVKELDCGLLNTLMLEHPEGVGRILLDNHYISNETDSVYQDRLGRFFCRRFFHFESAIHEQIIHNHTGLQYETYDLPLHANHTGYLGSIDELRGKVERNNCLLFQELESNKNDPYLYFQLGQSYNMIYDYENSYKYYQKALEFDINPKDEWVQMMIIAYANALLHTGRETAALQLEAVYDDFASSADFFCIMGQIYLANRQYMKAMMEFVKAIHCPVAHQTGTNSFIPTYNIGLINEMMGDISTALTHYRNCGNFPMAQAKINELAPKINESNKN